MPERLTAPTPHEERLTQLQSMLDAGPAIQRQAELQERVDSAQPVVQRQLANGRYTVNQAANLRKDGLVLRDVRAQLAARTPVDVIDNGGRDSYFGTLGLNKKEHSWVRLQDGREGWIEDGKLTAAPVAGGPPPGAGPAPGAGPPPGGAPAAAVAPPGMDAPAAPQQVEPLYPNIGRVQDGGDDGAHDHSVRQLLERVRAVGFYQATDAEIDDAIAAIEMPGGGGDPGARARRDKPEMVRFAAEQGYDVRDAGIRARLKAVIQARAAWGGGGGTTIGNFQGDWRGGAFLDFDKMPGHLKQGQK